MTNLEDNPARYDAIADSYALRAHDNYDDEHDRILHELLGRPTGQRLLDLACGHGRISRELARGGAELVGLDISARLLDHAKRAEQRSPLGIVYVHADAASSGVLQGQVFATVV
ncbi:MAG: class I SAM-dependent methyltransferase [Acidimicrobiales bacterium]